MLGLFSRRCFVLNDFKFDRSPKDGLGSSVSKSFIAVNENFYHVSHQPLKVGAILSFFIIFIFLCDMRVYVTQKHRLHMKMKLLNSFQWLQLTGDCFKERLQS